MPRRDGTGPDGKGPKTGRGLGPCSNGPKGGGKPLRRSNRRSPVRRGRRR